MMKELKMMMMFKLPESKNRVTKTTTGMDRKADPWQEMQLEQLADVKANPAVEWVAIDRVRRSIAINISDLVH